MTREQQIRICEKCINRKPNLQQGLLCSLTGEKADFTEECQSFSLDNAVVVNNKDDNYSESQDTIIELSSEELEKYQLEQNYSQALLAGIGAGLLGAILWAIITVTFDFQIGYMAIFVGAGVGFAIRYFGKGVEMIYGITGGIIALISCLLGNALSVLGYVADSEGLSYTDTVFLMDYNVLPMLMADTFSPIDLLFYAIAAYQAYKFSFRIIQPGELES